MYKLEHVHAVQYFLLEAETLDIDGITTGIIAPNGSGKSAILDAVQIVLLGGDQNAIRLNAQAGGDADGRSIRDYCLGFYNETSHARDHATTFLTLVFRDTVGNRPPVSAGIAIGATIAESTHVVYGWYLVDGVELELADHVEAVDGGKQPMAWATFKANVQARCKQGDARVEFELRSASAFLQSLLFRMRPDSAHDGNPKAFRKAFRNALNLTKVTDTDHFIRHLIAEERPINLERFREQLESFRELRRKISEVIARIDAAARIQGLYAKAIATRMHKASYQALAADFRRDAHFESLEAGKVASANARRELDAAVRSASQAESAAQAAQATLLALGNEARTRPEFGRDQEADTALADKQARNKKQLTHMLRRVTEALSQLARADPGSAAWIAIARPWAALLQRVAEIGATQSLEMTPATEEKTLGDTIPLLDKQLETTRREALAGIASDQDLRTLYNLDDYGNRIASFSCSAQDASGAPLSDAQCQDVSRVPQRPLTATGPTTAVHRYSRQGFDGNGRYAVNSFMPFFSPQAVNELSEGGAYSTVLERDEFGNATRQSDASGNETVARVGDLGRAYFAADATGAASTMTYAWCNGDNCPGGANFRQRTDVAGGASTFTYFDRLGREIVKVAQAFDEFEAGRNFSAVCTFYDAHSRAVEVSVPSFLESFFGNGDEPVFPGEPCVEGTIQPRSPSGFILSTRTTFDVLGRVIQVEAPDGSTATSEFDGLVTVTTDARGSQTRSERNALGEVISMRQSDAVTGEATGMEVTHEYDAQGNLRLIRRDAGLGEIVSETRYDVLGRPMEVIDPDRGTEQRFYNAAGEVIVGVDARGMRTEQDFDALGRVWRRRSGPGEAFMGGGGTGLPFGDGFEGTPLAPTGAGGSFAAIYTDTFQFDAQCAGPGGIRGLLAFEERRVGARSSCEAQGDPAAPPVPGEAGGLPSSAAYAQRLLQGDADTRIRHLYLYDLGRVITRFTQIDNSLTDAFEQVFTFDEFGRPATQTDARAIGSTAPDMETAIYTSRGYLYRRHYERPGVGAGGPVGVFEEIEEHDARAQVVRERIGPVSVVRETDDARGWLNSICAGTNCGLQDLGYGYDDEGHLRVRTRNGQALREDLIYDQLDRLTRVTRSGNATTPAVSTADYDALGNLCTRTVTGGTLNYTYAGRDGCNGSGTAANASPHAVSMTTLAGASTHYEYDLSGNLTLRDAAGTAEDRSTTTDARGQITQITLAGNSASTAFAYGPDGARYARIDTASGQTTRTLYVGRTERITRPTGPREIKRYLGAAIVTTCENTSGNEVACASGQFVEDRYVLGDHLGSLETLVSDTGTVIERTSFDAWGNRRDANTWSGTGTPLATTTHGFTGHEGIDALGLVHMNGRLFDPALARFIQADPMLDAGVQGMNRYSYVLNDPLSLTDPTGYYSAAYWFRQAINVAVVVASALSAQGGANAVAASALSTGAKLFLIGGAGATTAAVTSGNTRGSGWGAVSALAFYGIGTYFDSAQWASAGKNSLGQALPGVAKSGLNGGGYAAKVLAHGLTGGVMQSKQGGNFGSGFAAAGLTQAAGGYIDGLDGSHPDFSPIRVLSAALVGGTSSSITGGKFANGAVTGAFSRAFNDEGNRSRDAAPGSDQLSEMADHAYAILGRPAGSDGVKEMSFGELGVVLDYSAAYMDAKSEARGGYASLSPEEFSYELVYSGDSPFFGPESLGGFGGTRFRFLGAPSNLQGVHLGGDVNYYFQGFMQAARGNSLRGVHDTVIPWNISQGNFSRIPQRLNWATFGYDYYRSRP